MKSVVESVPDFDTLEEMFIYIINFLHKQGCAAYNEKQDNCFYRTEVNGKGVACAVGSLIPDKSYNPDYELDAPLKALKGCGVNKDLYSENGDFLSSIQHAHDNSDNNGGRLKVYLLDISKRYDLPNVTQHIESLDWSNWGK